MLSETDNRDGEKWDKLKKWGSVQEEIIQKLQAPEKMDQSLALNHGPQLYHTMRHPGIIKCMTHFPSSSGDIFITHYRCGTTDQLSVWTMDSNERDASVTQQRYEIHSELTSLMYVNKHRVYLGFSSKMELHVFTDASSQCQEKGFVSFSSTILSMAYNREADEVYIGGIGTLEQWKVTGSEHAATLSRVLKYETDIGPDEWVIDIKVDTRNTQLLILTYHNIFVINYETLKQTHHLQNRHEGSLKCCSFYKQREYFITGGGDGAVKVWNAVVFTQVHAFYGHNAAVTDLAVHKREPLLFSCSLDGSVQIWRMDNFSNFMRFDLSEKIYHLKLLSDEQFCCQTEMEIKVFGLNQFYNLFAPVESTVENLCLCPGKRSNGLANRIIASTEDGSVRLFSPVTGVALTLIYPMPSFQILTSFAYNREKDRLHTVLENGEVIVFNCRTNPCKAVEVWQSGYVDERITQMLQVELSYTGQNGLQMTDIVIFGGQVNGQVSLLDATVCEMVRSVQTHRGMITCMESVTEIDPTGYQMSETNKTIVTGGNDNLVKLWKIKVSSGRRSDYITLEPILEIPCESVPDHISMYENTLSVAIITSNHKGKLVMYRVEGSDTDTPQYTQLEHAEDDDHDKKITALDKCPLLGLFASCSEDAFIKIWNRHNQLIREMVFGEPLYALCFANVRGDLLFGFQNHVCSIPLTSYFPQNYLERIALLDFLDDLREDAVVYNSVVKPWFDPQQLPRYSTTLSQRVQEQTKKDKTAKQLAITDLEALPEDTSKQVEGQSEKENEENKQDADRIEENIDVDEKLKEDVRAEDDLDGDFEFSAEVEIGSPFEKPLSRVCQSQRSMVSRDKAGSRGDRKRNLSDGISPNNLDELLPWERELLKRRSNIIPKDGYIPNSVIRKNLAFVRPVTPTFRKKDIWTLKPVPEPDPRHMPSGWGGRPVEKDNSTLDIFEIARRYRLETMESDSQEDEEDEVTVEKEVQLMPCMQNRSKVVKKKRTKKRSQGYESDESGEEREFYSQQRRVSLLPPEKDPKRATPFTWMDDDDAAPKSTLNQFQKLTNMVRASSTLSNASSIRGGYSKSSRRSTPVTPKYELKSKKFEFRNDLETPDSMRGVRRLTNSGGAQSRERSKSFKLTNMVVDEDSTDVRYKDPSGKRGSMLGLNDMDSIQKLLEEDWFSDMRGTPSFDSIMQRLLTLLDTDDPDLHSKICDYILDLHKDFGIPDMYLDRIIHKLSAQLGNSTPVPINNLRTLQQIGGNRPDVLATLLPRLIDSQSDVREEMVSILAEMIGVNNKDDLLQLMQDMGFKSKYNSKEEEEEALKALATRLDIPYRTDSFTDWISNWVDESSSLFHDDADLKEGDISKNWDGRAVRVVPESLCITETSSRASNRLRELTNISDKSHLLEPSTPDMGRRQRSGMFDINRETQDEIPTTPKSQKANIRNSLSDEEEEEYDGFNPKDPAMYGYYKKRYPANIRPGSGRKLYGDEFGGVPSRRLQQFAKRGGKDEEMLATDSSHRDDGTDVAISVSEVGEKAADTTLETMSTQDSGIGKEISEILSSKSGMEMAVIRKGQHRPKQGWPKHSLSPVKSAGSLCPSGLSTPKGPENDKELDLFTPKTRRNKNWQRFFKTSTAQERKRMEMVKRDFDTGKVKQSNGPAVIQYIASDLPLLPGEAGLRLLHTVRVGNKGPTIDYDGRHRVESIPGKLMVQTKNEDTGKSNFGILQMQWTTGVPVATSVEDYLQYRQMASGQSERSQSHCTKSCDTLTEKSYASAGLLPNLQSLKHSKKKKKHVKETQLNLPRLHSRTTSHSHDYQWERPLPPPPVRKSSSQSSDVKKQHDHYCKYYDLTKKKMQQYTSSKTKDLLLPEVVIRNALGASPKLQKSLTKLSRGHSVLLPPITLNQLIHVSNT
ncbi:uncharacterized protein LOC110450754 isoform X2 [Mizuhopecten yessoensis]|uniref:uncharacterized protein LOC110450754 isoform X2 n=1 Tax=Mizuhopecten yessoensis TaxID=6573 RepID=UPI000B45D8E7|nr:uncharacterized protein LOC110450754 isoform X2 [Mizuhopecten yessoensis]